MTTSAAAAPALRDYQLAAVQATFDAFAAGTRSALIVAATGTGKTTSASEIVRLHLAAGGRRALVLAQRRELLSQLAGRLALFAVPVRRGLALGAEGVAHVASVQSAARRLAQLPADAFDLIILDEAQHSAAPQHLSVLRHFPGARLVGITATPDRFDGASLGLAFECCVARYDLPDAVRDGWLVPACGVRVEVEGLDLSGVRVRPIAAEASSEAAWSDVEDLHPGDLRRAALAPAAVEGVVGPLLELAGALRTVVFAVDVPHARAIVASICARRPDDARVVCGADRAADRDATLADFAAGKFQFLVNCLLLVEGYDLPSIGCVALARPTRSRMLVAQACGRALRPSPGKTEALVIDFTSATSTHSLVAPDDVLAGAMTAPSTRHASKSAAIAQAPAYVAPVGWRARFTTAVVELIRVGMRAVVGASRVLARRVPLPARRAAVRGVRALARLVRFLTR